MDLARGAAAPLLDDAPWWRVYVDLRGRLPRSGFWLHGVLAPIAAGLLLHAILGIARVRADTAEHLVNLLLLWPIVATSAKRWHDRDKSAWWVLIVLIPVLGWIWSLVANGFLRGTAGPNRFGADPLQPAALSNDR